MAKVEERIVRPTIDGLAADGIPYRGFVFIGLMNSGGEPRVVEYNVRMGDPETEVVFPRITSDAVELMEAIAFGRLERYELTVSPLCAATVVAVSGGYPGEYAKGKAIRGLVDEAGSRDSRPDACGGEKPTLGSPVGDGGGAESVGGGRKTIVFHSGTARKDGEIVTAGGRVLAVTSLAPSMDEALAASYGRLSDIHFEGISFRRDIGQDLRP